MVAFLADAMNFTTAGMMLKARGHDSNGLAVLDDRQVAETVFVHHQQGITERLVGMDRVWCR